MKIEWQNTFFAILSIIIILWFIMYFFGLSIPNFNQLQGDVKRAEIPTIINTSLKCDDILNKTFNKNYLEIYKTEEAKNFILEGECRDVCSSKSQLTDKYYLLVQYKTHHCDNGILICECEK